MKNRWKLAFLCLMSINIMALLLIISYIQDETERSVLYARIHQEISSYQNGEKPSIDFAEATDFVWETMFIFGPYSSCKKIVDSMNTPFFWFDCKLKGIESFERGSLLVFKKNRLVIRYVLYDGIYPKEFKIDGYPANNARFTINEKREIIWHTDIQ